MKLYKSQKKSIAGFALTLASEVLGRMSYTLFLQWVWVVFNMSDLSFF